jgi:hypothetical protein
VVFGVVDGAVGVDESSGDKFSDSVDVAYGLLGVVGEDDFVHDGIWVLPLV